MSKLTESTLIPIGLAVVVIGGGAVWLTVLADTVSGTSKEVLTIREKQDKYQEDIHQIKLDLTKIKTKMGIDGGE